MSEIVITGVARRRLVRRIVAQNCGKKIKIYRTWFIPPIVNFVPVVDLIDPLYKVSTFKRLRQVAIDGSKNINLLFPVSWVSIKIKIKVEDNFSYNSYIEFEQEGNINSVKSYISKHVTRLGFGLRPNANDSDYERLRAWFKYDILLINGEIKNKNFSLPASTKYVAEVSDEIVKIFQKSHFPILQWAKSPVNLPPGINAFHGRPYSVIQSDLIQTKISLVHFKKIMHARFLHGSFVFSESQFYFSDQLKAQSWRSLGNQWPSYLFALADGSMISPVPAISLPPTDRAIFIGGVNNLMHFAIEDLQKIFAIESLELEIQVPILINGNLSPEIKEFIQNISGRKLVEITEDQGMEIGELYFPFFKNFLFDAMAGDIKAAESMYSKDSYHYARHKLLCNNGADLKKLSRIYIRREAGLFRPLINAGKIQRILEKDFGFVTHYVGNLSLREAISIFQNAEIIIGEYGAGLAHMVLAPSGAKILEIRGPLERNALEYEYLAKILGLNHFKIVGVAKYLSTKGIARGPYVVDIGRLKKITKELIEESQ